MVPRNISSYPLLTFEPLLNLHLGVSGLVRKCKIGFFHRTAGDRIQIIRNRKRSALLHACSWSLAVREKYYYVHLLHIDLSKRGNETQLDELFAFVRLPGMLEGKIYTPVDTVFPLLAELIGICT